MQDQKLRVWEVAKQAEVTTKRVLGLVPSSVKSASSNLEPIFAGVLIDFFVGKLEPPLDQSQKSTPTDDNSISDEEVTDDADG